MIAQEQPTFRSDAAFVNVDVQVLAEGQPVLGLKKKDFLVWDNSHREPIASFGSEDELLDLILLVDVSSSTAPIWPKLKGAVAEAMSNLHFRDRVGIVMFNTKAYLVSAPTWDWSAVDRELRQMPWLGGGTELNASVLYTARYLRIHARNDARRAIIILTDNKAYRSMPDSAVREELWDANVVLDALLFADRTAGSVGSNADVRRFVRATGGEVLYVQGDSTALIEMFRRLRERYVLTYRSPGGRVGTMRHIKVDLSRDAKSKFKNIQVRAREGYRVNDGAG